MRKTIYKLRWTDTRTGETGIAFEDMGTSIGSSDRIYLTEESAQKAAKKFEKATGGILHIEVIKAEIVKLEA